MVEKYLCGRGNLVFFMKDNDLYLKANKLPF